MARLDALLTDARPLPLAKQQLMVERADAYAAIDAARAALPALIQGLRWSRSHRDAPDEVLQAAGEQILSGLDDLDNTIRRARRVPLNDRVRLEREGLESRLEQIRPGFDAFAREFYEYTRLIASQ